VQGQLFAHETLFAFEDTPPATPSSRPSLNPFRRPGVVVRRLSHEQATASSQAAPQHPPQQSQQQQQHKQQSLLRLALPFRPGAHEHERLEMPWHVPDAEVPALAKAALAGALAAAGVAAAGAGAGAGAGVGTGAGAGTGADADADAGYEEEEGATAQRPADLADFGRLCDVSSQQLGLASAAMGAATCLDKVRAELAAIRGRRLAAI
jgi:hypothetical protein